MSAVAASSSSSSSSSSGSTPTLKNDYKHSLFLCSNEGLQDRTQSVLSKTPLRGDTIVATSGLFAFDIASLDRGGRSIENVVVYDISERVAHFYQQLIPAIKKSKTPKEAEIHIKFIVQRYKDIYFAGTPDTTTDKVCKLVWESLDTSMKEGKSFLSSVERFARIKKIVENEKFFFRQMDFYDSAQTTSLMDFCKSKNMTIDTFYVSNILGYCHTLENYEGYKKSYALIPTDAIVIDVKDHTDEQRVAVSQEERSPIRCPETLFGLSTGFFRLNDGSPDLNYDRHTILQLIKEGAPIHMTNQNDDTPLISAAIEKHYETIHAYIAAKIPMDTPNPGFSNQTALHLCADDEQVVDLLVKGGANVNKRDDKKMTPLHRAVEEGSLNKIRALLRHKAKLHLVDVNGDTPYKLAEKKKNAAAMDILKKD